MNIIFKNYKEYFDFIVFLRNFCDEIKLVDDEDSYIQRNIIDDLIDSKWTKSFPGKTGKERIKVLSFKITDRLLRALETMGTFYNSNEDDEDCIDMAFYKGGKLVCTVIGHEELCILEDKYRDCYKNLDKYMD